MAYRNAGEEIDFSCCLNTHLEIADELCILKRGLWLGIFTRLSDVNTITVC